MRRRRGGVHGGPRYYRDIVFLFSQAPPTRRFPGISGASTDHRRRREAEEKNHTPCQTRRDMASEEAALPSREAFPEDRAFAKYRPPFGVITIVSRHVTRPIRQPGSWHAPTYTFHRTNLIIRSVFAAYFDCEILHLAFV